MSPRRFYALALLLFAMHVAVMLYMSPPSAVLGQFPLISFDFATHYEQCKRSLESFSESRRMWLWDPHLLAGQVSGAIFDADNKAWELWCILLVRFGVPFDRAFNLFVWLASGLLFPVVLASSRLLGVARRGALAAASFAALVWWFDGFTHWLWFVGMICWALAAYLVLLPLGLFVAFLRDRRTAHLVLLAPALALVHTVHPYSFLALVVPMLLVYLQHRRALSKGQHLAIFGVVAVTILANVWWLRVAFRFWHYILDSGFYLDATPTFMLWDWLALTKEGAVTGVIGNRSSFRFLALGLAAIALVRMRRRADDRLGWVSASLFVSFFIAYVGSLTPGVRQVQPYRFVLPGVMLACVLAGGAFDELWDELRSTLRARAHRPLLTALSLATMLVVPRFVRDILYFVPDLVPSQKNPLPLGSPNIAGPWAMGIQAWPESLVYRHASDHDAPHIESWVKKLDDGTGRFLVEWWMTGEQIAGRTDAQVLGGFREINLAHSDANFFRTHPDDQPIDPEVFRRYVETYNVKYVVLVKNYPTIEGRRDLLERIPGTPGTTWYRTRNARGWFVGGGPGTVKASNDRLVVRGSAGGNLVLRYHFLETLRCVPGCTLRRAPIAGNRVGFIGVEGAPRDFEIVNAP